MKSQGGDNVSDLLRSPVNYCLASNLSPFNDFFFTLISIPADLPLYHLLFVARTSTTAAAHHKSNDLSLNYQ